MWTDTTRKRHARIGPGLPSDLTDGEWEILEPFLPLPCHVGRPRKWPMRRIVEAMLCLLRGGLPWRMLPPGFPPATTVQRYLYLLHSLNDLGRRSGGFHRAANSSWPFAGDHSTRERKPIDRPVQSAGFRTQSRPPNWNGLCSLQPARLEAS